MWLTKEEFSRIAMGIKTYYPRENILPNDYAMELWYTALKDLDYQVIGKALQKHVAINKFPPTIADLRELSTELCTNVVENANESEAWELTYRALCNSTYNSESEFAKLPPMVQKAVGSPSQLRAWAIDENFNAGVESSNFKRVYRNVLEREKKNAQLQPNLRREALTEKLQGLLEV